MRIGIAVLLGLLMLVPGCVEGPQEASSMARNVELADSVLEVRDLRVEPTVVQSGATIQVRAVVVNRGTSPVYDLQLGVAIGEIGAVNGNWTSLDKRPSEPIKNLAPGEKVDFWEVVQIDGDGWFLVGIAGMATNAMLPPRGQKVHVTNPVAFYLRAIALFVFYIVLLGLVVATVWVLIGWGKGGAILLPHYALIGSGFGAMAIGILWFGVFRHLAPQVQPQVLPWLLLGGVILFATGWVLIGAGLGLQGQAWRGMIVAVALYILVGIGWVVAFNAGLGTKIIDMLFDPTLFLMALIWPLQVAQALGIFGLGFD